MSEKDEDLVQNQQGTIFSMPPVKVPKWIQGFINFVREQGVVGFGVGLILGLASKSLVDSFVNNFVNPIVGVILGGNNLATKFVCLKSNEAGICVSKIGYGQFLSDLINFLIIAAVVYFLVKGLKLDKLDIKKDAKDKPKT